MAGARDMTAILTLTMNPAVDVTTSTERVEVGRKLRCRTPRHEPGGGGINVARGIVILGGDAEAVYPAGGHTGQLLGHLVGETGVPHRAVELDIVTRESWSVTATEDGEHYHLVFPGPELTEAQWTACQDAVFAEAAPDYLVISGSLPPGVPDDFYVGVAAQAAERGTRCVLDTSGAPLSAALNRGGFYLIRANHHELSQACDIDGKAPEQCVGPLRELIDDGVALCLIMTLGSEGALLVTADEAWRAGPPQVEERSAVGAGDSFVAAFVHELHRTESQKDALVRAVAAAAVAVTTPGTRLFEAADVERLCANVVVDAVGG